jgi:methyl-accepting chemotaxis protein
MPLTLRKKLQVGGFVVSLLVIGSATYNFLNVISLKKSTTWVDHTHTVIKKATGVLAAAVDMETGMRGFLLAGKEEFLNPYKQGEKRFYAGIKDLKQTVSDNAPQVDLLGDIQAIIHEWQEKVTNPIIAKRRGVGENTTMDEISALVREAKGKVYFDNFRKQIKEFSDKEANLMEERKATAKSTASMAETSIIFSGLILIAITIGSIIFFNQSVIAPISQTGGILKDLASGEGDLTQRLPRDRKDEVGILAEHFNRFCEKIRETISHVVNSTETLNTTSVEMKAVAQGTLTSAKSMSSQSEGANNSIGDLSSNLVQITLRAKDVSTNVNSVASAIHEVDASINEVSNNCSEGSEKSSIVEDKANRTGVLMNELKKSASKIGSVVDTINNIAGKTDLLALNATIESASAGDAGKGFAVVANEVKELSNQTAASTEEISQLIQEVQSKTDAAAQATEEICHLINELNQTMQSISTSILQQSAATREITQTVEGSSNSVADISENIEQASSLCEELATSLSSLHDSSQEAQGSSVTSLSRSESLSDMSDELKGLVSQFKV